VQVLGRGDQRHEREDHDHVDPPVHAPDRAPLLELEGQQECDHQRRDEQRDNDRFDRHLRAERHRPDDRAADQQIGDAEQHSARERRQREAVEVKPAGMRKVGDAEAEDEFGERVAAERHEAPEHERVHEAGERALLDGPPLQDHIDDEAVDAEAEVGGRESVGDRRDQLNAPRHLRGKRADAGKQKDPEGGGLHHNLGTLSPQS
jgi:hypothetical protein